MQDDDLEIEEAVEADEKLVFEPSSSDPEDCSYVLEDSEEFKEENSEFGFVEVFYYLSAVLIGVLSVYILPLPTWLSGFLCGIVIASAVSLYVMWILFIKQNEEGTKFINNLRKKKPKKPAIIVQEELQRKYVLTIIISI